MFTESYHSSSSIVREGHSSVKMQPITNNGIIASWFDSSYFLDVLITMNKYFKIWFSHSLVTNTLLGVFYQILKYKIVKGEGGGGGDVARKIKEYI
uniref:Uncharacterized protein n=1 Tax=Glycine max TaxID=3847 RepID=A0A0R0GN03_SOYBN